LWWICLSHEPQAAIDVLHVLHVLPVLHVCVCVDAQPYTADNTLDLNYKELSAAK
jgi:hypothetical protein